MIIIIIFQINIQTQKIDLHLTYDHVRTLSCTRSITCMYVYTYNIYYESSKQIIALTGDQYVKIGVIENGNNPKVYIDTQTLQLVYDPLVYNGTWQSNHSGELTQENNH